MFSSDHKVVHHAKKVVAHMKKHQHTYLFFGGLAGGVFLFAKIVMLFGTSYMLYNASHDASFADDIVIEIPTETSTGSVEEEIPVETSSGTIEEIPTETSTGSVEEEIPVETSSGTTEEIPTETSTGSSELLDEDELSEDPLDEEYGFQETPAAVCDYSGFSSNIISGALYTGTMTISWTISPECFDEIVDIQLYDHNEEWITLARLPGTTTQYVFDTTLLGSGFYTQTGLNASGEVIPLVLGLYPGIPQRSWTGYHLRWLVQPDTILSETPNFIIDNNPPIISNIVLSSSGVSSGVIAPGKPLVLQFDSSEQLTGLRVSLGTGQAVFSGLSGNHYIYTVPTFFSLTGGYVGYTISYQDFAGFTGVMTGISQLYYDALYPQFTGFSLSGYDFSFITSELTRATSFVLLKNTTNGWAFSMTGTATGHTFSLPTLSLSTDYDMGIVAKDLAGNESKAAFSLKRNNSGAITFTLLATLYGQTLTTYASGVNFLSTTGNIINTTTGVQETSIMKEFKEEIDKFAECKENIDYTKIKLQIKGTELLLNMPTFKKSEIKKLVNSFILYILKNLETSPLSDQELQDIAQNFDKFSVILKLIKDDNNTCKQTLSNYHLDQFEQSLEMYGISL